VKPKNPNILLILLLDLRQEMYSEERREVMQQQVTSLHHHSTHQEQQHQLTVSKEAQEWQEMARREKHHVEYAESSHFSMVSFFASIQKGFIFNVALVNLLTTLSLKY